MHSISQNVFTTQATKPDLNRRNQKIGTYAELSKYPNNNIHHQHPQYTGWEERRTAVQFIYAQQLDLEWTHREGHEEDKSKSAFIIVKMFKCFVTVSKAAGYEPLFPHFVFLLWSLCERFLSTGEKIGQTDKTE